MVSSPRANPTEAVIIGIMAENVFARVTPNSFIAAVNIIKAMLEQKTDNMRIGYQKFHLVIICNESMRRTSKSKAGTIKYMAPRACW